MWAFLATGARKFGGWIIAGLSLAATLAVIWVTSRKVGKAEATSDAAQQRSADNEAIAVRQVNEERAASQTKEQAIKNANDANSGVNSLDASAIADELRNDWQRPDATAKDNNAGNPN